MKRVSAFLGAVLCFLPFDAQIITRSIVGNVHDPTDAPVPGAAVTLIQASTDRERTTETDAGGTFVFSGLEAGGYMLSATKSGFKKIEARNVRLATGERLSVGTLVLALGAVSEIMTVQAQAAVVQTESAERADVVTGAQADNLLTLGP